MTQSLAVWFVILVSIITANLPFIIQKPLLILPWNQGRAGAVTTNYWLLLLISLVYFGLLIGISYLFYGLIASSVVFNNAQSLALFFAKILIFALLVGVLMYLSVRLTKAKTTDKKILTTGFAANIDASLKPFISRLIEIFVLFLVTGTMALALEANMGSIFPKTWEFYAICASLYLVVAYPGFVLRYLTRKRRKNA